MRLKAERLHFILWIKIHLKLILFNISGNETASFQSSCQMLQIFLNLHSLAFLPHRSLYIICICWPTVSETRHPLIQKGGGGGRKRQSGKPFKAFDGSSLIDAGTSSGQRGQRWRGRDFGEVHRPLCKHTLRFLRCALLLPRNKLPFPWSQL